MLDDFEPDLPDENAEFEQIQLERIDRQNFEETHRPAFFLDITAGRVIRPPWLFDDFLLSHSLTLVSGEPFAGKSLFLIAMALSLDSGEPLFGSFQPTTSQRVLFIGQDSPTWDYIGQAQKLARGMNAKNTNGSMMLLNKGFDLFSPETQKILEEAIDLYHINVLMLDTLLELHNLDENSNVEMKRVMGFLKHLRDKHYLSIFATTHTAKAIEGKSANYRIRGASVIAGSVDQHILLRPHFAASRPDGFYLKIPKSRGGERPEDSQVVRFVAGEPTMSPSLQLEYAGELYSERQEIILSVLSGPTQRKKVAEALRAKYPKWSELELQRRTTNSLTYLEQKGFIKKIERGIYQLIESPPTKGASQPT